MNISFIIFAFFFITVSNCENCATNEKDSPLDCNKNGALDSCDIKNNVSLDRNMNNVPDECEPACTDCFRKGVCVNSLCYCYPKYYGVTCAFEDICFEKPCGQGYCDVHDGKCVCPSGKSGIDCEELDCGPNGWYNSLKRSCLCFPGYYGPVCDRCKMDLHGRDVLACCPIKKEADKITYVPVYSSKDRLGRIKELWEPNLPCIIPNGKDMSCDCKPVSVSNKHGRDLEDYIEDMWMYVVIENSLFNIVERNDMAKKERMFNRLEEKKNPIEHCESSSSVLWWFLTFSFLVCCCGQCVYTIYFSLRKSKPNKKGKKRDRT